jgi:phenylacetate-CoA ligase
VGASHGVSQHVAALAGDDYHLGEFRVVATSGTSGLRGIFVYDRQAWRIVLANTLRWNRLMNVRPRLPFRLRIASIGADSPMHVTERIPRSADVGLFKVRHFHATAPIRSLARDIGSFRPDVVLAYPSVAALLAAEQLEGRISIAPRVVSTHSEVLTDEMREKIHAAWGVSPFNHYGLTEEPHVAADCERHEGLHIFEDTSLVEIVDGENRPVPGGTPGAKYLLTNLYNYTQPLIRYEVTDVLTRAPGPCSCGRPFALISAIGGRSEDVLYLPAAEGRGTVPVMPLAIVICLESIERVVEFAVTHSPQRIEVSIVAKGDGGQALEAAVAGALRRAIGEAGAVPPPVEVHVVDRIERPAEKMGKMRLVGAARKGGVHG